MLMYLPYQRRVHFMMCQTGLRFEATRGPLQRPQRRRAIRHGGGGRSRCPELPRRRHRLAKVSEMLRNKLERDLTREKGGRQSESGQFWWGRGTGRKSI